MKKPILEDYKNDDDFPHKYIKDMEIWENENKKYFKIPVTWESYGVVEIEAETLEQAIEIFDKTIDDIELPDAEYVDASFQREDEDTCKALNNMNDLLNTKP